MEKETNKIESTGAGVEKIHTKLKFIKSDKNGALISFVSQNPVNDVVCGVRQDSPYPKKIVIIDREMSNNILINVLYDCTLIPMGKTLNEKTGEEHVPGYIAIEANPVQFKATISTKYIRGIKYNVEVSFGNKIIRFDPFRGQKESVKSLPACRAILERRCDVKDLMDVVDDFTTAATNLIELMKQDMMQINGNKKTHKANRGNRH
jgi:hypothetical protein